MTSKVAKLSTSAAETGRLLAALEPATDRQSDIMLSELMDRGFSIPEDVKADQAARFYAEVLRGKPVGSMRRVFENLRLGRYERFRSFLPKPAELSALIDEAARHDREMLRLERRRAAAARERAETARPELTSQERESRRKKVAEARAFIRAAAQSRVMEGAGDGR